MENWKQLQSNFDNLQLEWMDMNETLYQDPCGLFAVKKKDIEALKCEVSSLKRNLPSILTLTSDFSTAVNKLSTLHNEIDNLRKENDSLKCERDHWKSRYESALSENEKQTEEKFQLRCEVQTMNDQLNQQSQYLYSMGAASCTLLWRVSRCEDSIESILMASKVSDFLTIVNSTVHSYTTTYKDEKPPENSDETQFILALCGIITNIAASAYGRNFLVTNDTGVILLETMMDILSDLKHGHCIKIKNLILMTLYNVSINQKGLKIITSKQGIIGLLVWLLQGENDAEIQLNSIRLVQSLLIEQTNTKIILQAKEVISVHMLQQLADNSNTKIRDAALELMSDMRNIKASEQ